MLDNPFVLLALSIVPGLVYVSIYYNMDKHRKEPLGVILRAFFWGSFLVLPIGLFQSLFPDEIFMSFFPLTLAYMVLLIGFTEELGKWLVIRYYAFRETAFDEVTDGLVYGACTAGGFAVFENIFYVFDHGFETGILRSILSVPGHIFWGAISGYWLAMYKFAGTNRITALWKGLGVAILSHGLFNTCLSFDFTIVFAPVIVIVNGITVRRYFRQAMEHDANNIHNFEIHKSTEISEHVELSEDGQLVYKKEKVTHVELSSGFKKLIRFSFHLIGWVFIVTGLLAAIGTVIEENPEPMDSTEEVSLWIFICVLVGLGVVLIYKAIRMKKTEVVAGMAEGEKIDTQEEILTVERGIPSGSLDREKFYNKEKPPYQV